ncbi:MAG TPA: hypothetical protein VGN80_08805 [Devosiaceae bacterium]|jgi:hypothetical protein|nr:hypothetical protein [Devosiaceae bacterium]
MRKLLPALLLASCAFYPVATPAAEFDAETELLIRCGAGYMIVAEDDELMDSEADAENLRSMGLMLLQQADSMLIEQGLDGDAREAAGERLATEVATALEAKTDPGFETSQCTALLEAAAAEPAESKAPEVGTSEEIDKLMTCGAGFYVTAEASKEEGDEDTARNLGALAETLIGRADQLMIDAGMGEEARFELSKQYGQQVGETIYAGEELAYDWETCANLAY